MLAVRLLAVSKQRLTMSMWPAQSAGWSPKICSSNVANYDFIVHMPLCGKGKQQLQSGSSESCLTLESLWLL